MLGLNTNLLDMEGKDEDEVVVDVSTSDVEGTESRSSSKGG